MRLKKIKNAYERLHEDNKYFVSDPQNHKNSWHKMFNNINPLHVEIGCGKGRFIIGMAKEFPNINFVAIEKFDSVLIKTLENAHEHDLPNLRLVLFDAIKLEALFEKDEVSNIYLNFSDPWPKKKHERRRLTYKSFLDVFSNVLDDYGTVIQKTDNRLLFESSIESFSKDNWYLKDISLDLHKTSRFNIQTEYEEKWSKKGPIYTVKAFKNSLLVDTLHLSFHNLDINKYKLDISDNPLVKEDIKALFQDIKKFEHTQKEVSLEYLLKHDFYVMKNEDNDTEDLFYSLCSKDKINNFNSDLYAVVTCKFNKLDEVLKFVNSKEFIHQRYNISKDSFLITYQKKNDIFTSKIYFKSKIN